MSGVGDAPDAVRVVIEAFHTVKAGNDPLEYEDRVVFDERCAPGLARCIVLDGATEAFDALWWVTELADGFVDDGPGTLSGEDVTGWLGALQQRWSEREPAFSSSGPGAVIERHKFREHGSFATLLGCEVDDLGGRGLPRWRAVALGDTVLFHVRGDTLRAHFPPLSASEFGINPDGAHTRPDQLDRMRSRMRFGGGEMEVGDRLYVATDALAEWMLRRVDDQEADLWRLFAGLHPRLFDDLVREQRSAGALKNDDVTLTRLTVTCSAEDVLVVAP